MNKIYDKLISNHFVQLLSDSTYLYFSLSVFFSQIAANMLTIVLIFLVFYLTSSSFAVSMLLFAILIPQIFVSFIGGVVADGSSKKVILILGNILRAIALLILFLNFKSISLIYATTFLISIITQFYVPAESPLIPQLVEREKLVAANSIFGMSFFGSILIGYIAAGPAVKVLGRSNTFILISGFFLLAALFASLVTLKTKEKKVTKIDSSTIKKSIRMEFAESFWVLRKTRDVSDAFFLLIFSQIIIFILATLIPGYAKTILQVAAEDLSIILFAPAAIGMSVAALLLGSVFTKTPKKKITSIGIFISGAVLFLFPFTSKILAQGIIGVINTFLPLIFRLNVFNFVLVLAFLAGFANALIFVPSQAMIQEVTPPDFTSKIYGLLFALIGLFSVVPIMIAGGVADVFGVGTVLFSIGTLILIAGLIREKVIVNFLWTFVKQKKE